MVLEKIDDRVLPMSALRLAPNNFFKENLMKETPFVVLYKGQLTDQSGQSIPIVARRYTNLDVSLNMATTSICHIHKNIATLFKVAVGDDDDIEILHICVNVLSKGYHIYKYEVNGSLDKHLSSSTLTWMQRLHVCLDVANVLRYTHNELCNDQSMIHVNMKSSKIRLNHNWEPTLHGLRADMFVKKHDVHRTNNYDGSLQYTDPAYGKTKALSHKL
ncbi:kinase-like domain, phloem protein 2-like protein [Tanacetum coccineum]